MKTIKKGLTIGATTVLGLFLVIFSCRDTKEDVTEFTKNASSQTNSAAATTCNCATTINNDCNDCVRNTLMKGNVTQSYGLKWDNCNNGCSISGQTSSLTFCYDANAFPGNCDMWIYVDYLPSCLSTCLGTTGPVCLKVTGSCTNNGNDVVVNGTYIDSNGNSHEFSFTFSNDPKVTVCCSGICCTGETF